MNVYLYHVYAGKKIECEENVDKLRSILAQMEFTRDYDQKGVPFTTHLHVPEIHPDTGHTWYEREDPAHVEKVCLLYTCTCIVFKNVYNYTELY